MVDSISPLPFRKAVELYQENARLVFGERFKKGSWDNEKDLASLMSRYQGAFLKRRPRPAFIPVSDDAVAAAVAKKVPPPRRQAEPPRRRAAGRHDKGRGRRST